MLYLLLLLAVRKSVLAETPTPLSHRLAFLHQDMEPRMFAWEIVEISQKLILVGFCVLIRQGTIEQLLAGFFVCQVLLLFSGIARPYRHDDDNYFSLLCNFALCAVFVFCLIFKMGVLSEAVDPVLTDEMRHQFAADSSKLAVALFVTIAGHRPGVAVCGRQLVEASQTPIIKMLETRQMPHLELHEGFGGTSSCRTSGAQAKTRTPPSSGSSACCCQASRSFWTLTTCFPSTRSRSTSTLRR